MLVTQLLDPNTTCLPTPNQLKGRILIKHKKLMVEGEVPERTTTVVPDPSESDFASFMSDLSNSTKNGYLFMQDPIDKVRRYMELCCQQFSDFSLDLEIIAIQSIVDHESITMANVFIERPNLYMCINQKMVCLPTVSS